MEIIKTLILIIVILLLVFTFLRAPGTMTDAGKEVLKTGAIYGSKAYEYGKGAIKEADDERKNDILRHTKVCGFQR